MILPDWVYWTLTVLAAAGIVGGLVAKRRGIQLGLIVLGSGFLALALAWLVRDLKVIGQARTGLTEAMSILGNPGLTDVQRARATDVAQSLISDLGGSAIWVAVDGGLLALTVTYLLFAIVKPETLLSPTGRGAFAAEKARKALAATPTHTGTPA